MILTIRPDGDIHSLYNEVIDLHQFGPLRIRRASHVEPDDQGRWWADMSPVTGPILGPFTLRSEALDAESHWLEHHRL